jgi:hypothetical protein
MYYKLICLLYAFLCGQNFILVKSGCYRVLHFPVANGPPAQVVGVARYGSASGSPCEQYIFFIFRFISIQI